MPPKRLLRLVIDEDLSWRVTAELRARGFREATSVKEQGVANRKVKDPVLLWLISRLADPCILVTYDNKMAVVHRDAILKRHSTVAVIDSKADRGGLTVEQYKRDVIHRWAHRMAAQQPATVRKYRRDGHGGIAL